jgi:hypothetical protein
MALARVMGSTPGREMTSSQGLMLGPCLLLDLHD